MTTKTHSEITLEPGTTPDAVITTGTTMNMGAVRGHYIKPRDFMALYGIDLKTLERYRKKIIETKTLADQVKYFVLIDGTYCYTRKILELRRYNRHRNITRVRSRKIVDGSETLRSSWVNWMGPIEWQYKCTINFELELSKDACVERMALLYHRLVDAFPTGSVTVFYACEPNPGRPGFHVHFVVRIAGVGLKNKKRGLETVMLSLGTSRREVQVFNEEIGESWIRYITKQTEAHPDGVLVHTNEEGGF